MSGFFFYVICVRERKPWEIESRISSPRDEAMDAIQRDSNHFKPPRAILDGKVASGTRATGKNACTVVYALQVASPTVNNPMHVREHKIGNFPIPECDVTALLVELL